MSSYVLDASAVLAVLQNEPGKENVEAVLDGAIIGRINYAEILITLVNKGSNLADAIAAIESLELTTIELDKEQAEKNAELRPLTKHLGLSLGDRACLALAIRENATAITADQNWLQLGICAIKSIR